MPSRTRPRRAVTYPPGPRGLPGLGNILEFRRDQLGFLLKVSREYGDIAHYQLGPFHVVALSHPDYVKDMLVTRNRLFRRGPAEVWLRHVLGQGLLTSEGDFHLRQRRLVQPAFHRQRIAGYSRAMIEYADRLAFGWVDGATVDVSQEMMRLTLAIVAKTLFGADMSGDVPVVGPAISFLNEYIATRSVQVTGGLLQRLPLPSTLRFRHFRAQMDATIFRLIARRRASGKDEGDLLSMLLLAQDTEGDGGSMTDQQVRDEVMTLFVAGHETTALALSWTWYLLSEHPEAESRLHAELDQVLGGRLPTMDDLPRLPYTRAVLAESMRLYPPAWGIPRILAEEYQVGGYVIPAGWVVIANTSAMHRDPRYYPDPERFDPDRWRPDVEAGRPRYAYFPFGGGPRQCIGESFAWAEGILVIATLAQRWRLRLVPGYPVEPFPLITLRQRHGVRMTLHARRESAAVPAQPTAAEMTPAAAG